MRPILFISVRSMLSGMSGLPFLDELAKLAGKPADYDVFQSAWATLFQRFENTLVNGNFPWGFQRRLRDCRYRRHGGSQIAAACSKNVGA